VDPYIHGNMLNWLIFLPVIGAVLCLVAPSTKAVKFIALATTGVVLLLSLLLFQHFAWWGDHDVFGSAYGKRIYEVTKLTWITLGSGENA